VTCSAPYLQRGTSSHGIIQSEWEVGKFMPIKPRLAAGVKHQLGDEMFGINSGLVR